MRMNRKLEQPDIDEAVKRIKSACDSAEQVGDVDTLRGHEGDGSAAYFGVFNALLRPVARDCAPAKKEAEGETSISPSEKAQGWATFAKRVRRPPTDPVNSLLSFGYTLLANDMSAAVNVVGFDPYVGYLHAERYGRTSLPLDLIEEFRPVIVDSVVVSAINTGALTQSDFQEELGGIFKLTPEGRKTFLKLYEERKKTEFKHPVLGQTMTYQQCFEQQARFLAKTLMGELEAYPPLLIK